MKYAYYPGCSLHSTGSEYDESFKAVCNLLGIELEEPKGWVCCGTSPAHSSSRLLSIALPVKNLELVEKAGYKEVLVPCASCFSRFKFATYEMEKHPHLKNEVAEVIGTDIPKDVKTIHPLEVFLNKVEEKIIVEHINKNLPQLKVACYYGCLLTRPPKVAQFDECEYPVSMDRILNLVGIKTLDWNYKTECCGGAFALSLTDTVVKLCQDILKGAKDVGANAIAVACPLCHANLDTRQAEIEEKYSTQYQIPIVYFTQLMGLAFGIEPEDLGLHKHLVSTEGLISKEAS
jgi:heterodisulfide reductase subunit B